MTIPTEADKRCEQVLDVVREAIYERALLIAGRRGEAVLKVGHVERAVEALLCNGQIMHTSHGATISDLTL